MNKFEQIKAKIADMESDANKFYNAGIAAAGTRVRKGLQEIKVLASEGRQEVTELKAKK